jgi:hypothetical protein|tara:strand:+ start:3790 stop:3990 length:201 start_codon:yes stop_codon:yes gene_type:complete
MKTGDIVACLGLDPWGEEMSSISDTTGLVIRVIQDVEYSPLIEVLWNDGYVSRVSQDELAVLNEDR